jgi:predicted transcriptional regulator
MATISVKLSDTTRDRVQTAALNLGLTPHALMVHAIEDAVEQAETRQTLIEQALASRQLVANTGLVVDGAAFGDYLKAKVRGQATKRPAAVGIENFITRGK